MPTAYVHLPAQVHYRREAFINGLSRLGYIVVQGQPAVAMKPNDVAVVWNKTVRSQYVLNAARKAGAAVIVAENGYYGADEDGRQPYALALDGHNGSGRWFVGGRERLDALDVPFQPNRTRRTGALLVAAQRGIGSPLMASPKEHAMEVSMAIAARYPDVYRFHIRPHPGQNKPKKPLWQDLLDVEAVIVWSSNCATAALVEGVPVFYDAPAIVTEGAAVSLRGRSASGPSRSVNLQQTFTDESREKSFQRLAWAQWFLREIESGEALNTLICVHEGSLPSCQKGFGL